MRCVGPLPRQGYPHGYDQTMFDDLTTFCMAAYVGCDCYADSSVYCQPSYLHPRLHIFRNYCVHYCTCEEYKDPSSNASDTDAVVPDLDGSTGSCPSGNGEEGESVCADWASANESGGSVEQAQPQQGKCAATKCTSRSPCPGDCKCIADEWTSPGSWFYVGKCSLFLKRDDNGEEGFASGNSSFLDR